MSGRHRGALRGKSSLTSTIALAVAGLVVVAGAWGIQASRDTAPAARRSAVSGTTGTATIAGSGRTTPVTASTSSPTKTRAASAASRSSSTGSQTASARPQPAASESKTAAGGPMADLLSCKSEVVAGDRLAEASYASYADWSTLVQADVDLNHGRNTLAQTKSLWASGTARGPQDLVEFADAESAYRKVTGSCEGVGDVTAPKYQPAAQDCLARSKALASVAQAGDEVNADWKVYIALMADEAHTDSAAYSAGWQEMVRAAPAHLSPYVDTMSALASAPACVIP